MQGVGDSLVVRQALPLRSFLMALPRPLPTGSQLDVSFNCPGSREVEHVEPIPSPAMLAGQAMHSVFQRWVDAGCPAKIEAPPEVAKRLAPRERIPSIWKHLKLAGVAEVAVSVDPVHEKASILCVGRRARPEEYPPGEHLFSGTLDAIGILGPDADEGAGALGVVDWKGRTRSDWQVRLGGVAASLLTGESNVYGLEVFNPSGFHEGRWLEVEKDLVLLREHARELLAQRAGFPARFQAGEWCKYCRAYQNCPIRDKAVEFRPEADKRAWTKR